MPGGPSSLTRIYSKLRMAAERTADAAVCADWAKASGVGGSADPERCSLGGSALALSEQAFLARFDADAMRPASSAGDGRAASAQETVTVTPS